MSKGKQDDRLYSKGDEIVHTNYGVGEIIDIEKKELEGKTTLYYVVKTKDSTFWMPVEKADADRIRLVVSSKTIEDDVIKVMGGKPQEMAEHYKSRRKSIRDAEHDGDIISTAELVRDLSYRRAVDRLNTTERRGLNKLKNRLVTEWSTSMDISPNKVRVKINKILQRHHQDVV
ncbi:MAG: CarD family transcriptional regulator [Chloroflexota bacterium]|nr:CarD family transcriptional regulator [Chloroflexota bacterium]